MKKSIAVIINPISGNKRGKNLSQLLESVLNPESFDLFFSQSTEHLHTLAKDTCAKDYNIVVAAGGDGTVNIIASYLIHTHKLFYIIPLGSGNGFARMLGISMNIKRAVERLKQPFSFKEHDTYYSGHLFFLNVAGLGFDALISHKFATLKNRGLWGYVRMIVKALPYSSQEYVFEMDGLRFKHKAFLISFSNGTQWGNNMFIAPNASSQDNLLDITILQAFPIYMLPLLLFRLRFGTFHKSKYVKYYKAKQIKIEKSIRPLFLHTDGEPHTIQDEINIQHAGWIRILD